MESRGARCARIEDELITSVADEIAMDAHVTRRVSALQKGLAERAKQRQEFAHVDWVQDRLIDRVEEEVAPEVIDTEDRVHQAILVVLGMLVASFLAVLRAILVVFGMLGASFSSGASFSCEPEVTAWNSCFVHVFLLQCGAYSLMMWLMLIITTLANETGVGSGEQIGIIFGGFVFAWAVGFQIWGAKNKEDRQREIQVAVSIGVIAWAVLVVWGMLVAIGLQTLRSRIVAGHTRVVGGGFVQEIDLPFLAIILWGNAAFWPVIIFLKDQGVLPEEEWLLWKTTILALWFFCAIVVGRTAFQESEEKKCMGVRFLKEVFSQHWRNLK